MKKLMRNMTCPAFALFSAIAGAQGITGKEFEIDIGSLPITLALNQWSHQTGMQVIVPSGDSISQFIVPSLRGRYAARVALEELIAGTPFQYAQVNDHTFVVQMREISSPNSFSGAKFLRIGMNTLAQGAVSQGDSTQASSSETNNRSSNDSDRARGLEEVIVSAQRRDEKLLETPISIGVLSGDALDQSSSRGVADVLSQVGGVSMIETQPGQVQIAVRGVLSGAGTSTTGYYQDEVPFAYVARGTLPDTNAFDLERVEVLRGPQGTLYGVNALSGVVRVLTNEANLDDFEWKARTRGSHTQRGGDNYAADMAINVPLIAGKLAVRGVASYSSLSGYIDSSADGGRDINDSEAQSYRLKMKYQPSEDLSIGLGLSRSKIRNDAPALSFDDFTSPFSSNQPDERVYDTYNLVAQYSWSKLSLLSSTSYLEFDPETVGEILLSGTTRLSVLTKNPLEAFGQEFRFTSQLESPWQWSAGAMYREAKEKIYQTAPALFPAPGDTDYKSESHAVFGEVTRSFGERFDATAGIRYFEDTVTRTDISYLSGAPVLVGPAEANFDRATGRVVVSYKPRAGQMIYGSAATGFRSGLNRDTGVAAIDPGFPALKPDSLVTYEVGTKGDLLGGAATYELSAYYTEWEDIQQQLIIPIGFSTRVNAGNASGPGVDASLSLRPTPALSFAASVGWNDLTLDDDVFQRGFILFAKGTRLNESPELTGSISGSYRTPMQIPAVDFVISTNFSYGQSRLLRFLTANALNVTESDPLKSWTASAGLEGDRWTLDVFGENLLNEEAAITAPSSGAGFTSVRQRPRTIGLQVTFQY